MQARTVRPFACLFALGLAAVASAEPIVGLTTTNRLVVFDSATPGTIATSVAITGLQPLESIVAIDFRPATHTLYGLGSTSRLYTLDPTTGAATQIGSAGAFTLSGTAFGFDFNPTVDRIRVVSTNGQNLRLNPNDGTLTATDTPLAYASGDVNAAVAPRVVGSAYSNNFAGASTTTLYAIDSNLDVLAVQTPPNAGTLNSVGALGFNTSDFVGFDISPLSGVSFASLTAPTGNFSQLFSIDLATGAATLIGSIGGGVPLFDISAAATAPVPEPGTWALLGAGVAVVSAATRRRRGRAARNSSGATGGCRLRVSWTVLFSCAAAMPVAGHAADRVHAGQWEVNLDVAGRSMTQSTCLTQADADLINGDARSIRQYSERVGAKAGCKVGDVKIEGDRVTVTSVCASGKENVGTTTYHGDAYETVNTNGAKARARRVGACK